MRKFFMFFVIVLCFLCFFDYRFAFASGALAIPSNLYFGRLIDFDSWTVNVGVSATADDFSLLGNSGYCCNSWSAFDAYKFTVNCSGLSCTLDYDHGAGYYDFDSYQFVRYLDLISSDVNDVELYSCLIYISYGNDGDYVLIDALYDTVANFNDSQYSLTISVDGIYLPDSPVGVWIYYNFYDVNYGIYEGVYDLVTAVDYGGTPVYYYGYSLVEEGDAKNSDIVKSIENLNNDIWVIFGDGEPIDISVEQNEAESALDEMQGMNDDLSSGIDSLSDQLDDAIDSASDYTINLNDVSPVVAVTDFITGNEICIYIIASFIVCLIISLIIHRQ